MADPLTLLLSYLLTSSRFIPRHSGASFAKRIPTRNLVKPNRIWFNREDGEIREEKTFSPRRRRDTEETEGTKKSEGVRKTDCRLKTVGAQLRQ